MGYNGSSADITGATGTALIGGGYGVLLQEFSMAHTDNCYFSGQTLAGVLNTGASRVHSVTSTFNGCAIGIDGRGLTNLGETSNTFTGCASDRYVRGGSIRVAQGTFPVDDTTDYSAPLRDATTSFFVQATTQSAALVTAYTRTFQAKECQNRGTGFDIVIAHGITGVVNTKTVEVSLGGVVLLTATIGAAVANTRIELEMRVVTATNSLNVTSRIFQDGIAPVVAYTSVTTVDMTTATRDLVVKHKVTNVADTSRLLQIETYLHR